MENREGREPPLTPEQRNSGDRLELPTEKYRILVAMRYWSATNLIHRGLERQRGTNDFHFLITLRSFIEYSRRGIWFLAWATEHELRTATKLTFSKSGSPGLVRMDEMINEARDSAGSRIYATLWSA